MKILKIEFKNINSLVGTHSIDFTNKPFIDNNLFAITGATGSGKSTILDVIPLALFNKVPRLNTHITQTVVQKFGAILTRGQKEAYAKIQYACKDGIYTSTWSIHSSKKGKIQDYEMFIYDVEGNPITQKKSEVPSKNESLIGLNYDQFIKSVMLAQGEFSKFLKVKKEERSALLEQITGTDIYRRIGIAAFEKYKSFKSSVEDWEKSIQNLQSKLLDNVELESLQKEECSYLKEQDLQVKQLESIKEKQKKLIEWQRLKQNLNQTTIDLNQRKTDLQNFETKEGERLVLHEKTETFAEDLIFYSNLVDKKNDLQTSYKTKLNSLDVAEAEKNNVKSQIFKWLNVADLKEDEIPFSIERFRKKVLGLIEDKKTKLIKYKEIEKEINYLLSDQNLAYTQDVEGRIRHRLDEVDLLLKSSNTKELSRENYLAQKENLNLEYKNVQEAERLAGEIKYLQKNILEKKENKKKKEEILKDLPEQIKTFESQSEILNSKYNNVCLQIENQNLRKTLDDFRKQLKEDEPCPLCGSENHPYAEHLPHEDNALQQEKKALQIKKEENQKKLIESDTKLKSLQKDVRVIEEELFKLVEKLNPLDENFKTNYSKYSIAYNYKESLEKLSQEIVNLEKTYQAIKDKTIICKVLPLIEQLEIVKKEGIEIKNVIQDLIADKDPDAESQRLVNLWNKSTQYIEQEKKNFKDLKEEISTNQNKIEEIEQNLLPKIKVSGFEAIGDALQSRLSMNIVRKLREQREKIYSDINRLEGTQKVYQENIAQTSNDLKQTNKEELDLEEQNLRAKMEEIDKQLKIIFSKVNQNSIYLKEIDDLQQKILLENQVSRVWRLLDSMIGDAKGKKFNDFAQELTLSHLLHLANKRLVQLKSRYLLSQPLVDEDEGLIAIDKDMANQRRSVKTLSGGESFILSLALALALSDLASRNVKIDTLFVDEGFGTLDAETLDKTLDTLERLQQENQKTIGVISHVETLKERISTQIKLSKNGYGLSDLKIVG